MADIIEIKEEVEIGNIILEKGDKIEIIQEKRTSDIGAGTAEIYRSTFKDSLAYFKNEDEVYVAKDEDDAIEKSLKGVPTVLVTNAFKEYLRAYPVVDGVLRLDGMASGSFIYTSNNVVMRGYYHPINLLDRFE